MQNNKKRPSIILLTIFALIISTVLTINFPNLVFKPTSMKSFAIETTSSIDVEKHQQFYVTANTLSAHSLLDWEFIPEKPASISLSKVTEQKVLITTKQGITSVRLKVSTANEQEKHEVLLYWGSTNYTITLDPGLIKF